MRKECHGGNVCFTDQVHKIKNRHKSGRKNSRTKGKVSLKVSVKLFKNYSPNIQISILGM